jgi:phage terminase large subunit-like protein
VAEDGFSRDYVSVANEYAKKAAADKNGEQHSKWVRLAAQRHLDDLKRAEEGLGYYFDEWHANDVCDFIEKLPHVEGVWESPTIELEPWQIFILCVIFGWRRKSDGLRRFTYVMIEVARKAAKSTLTAGVSLYCLCCEEEIGPQIVVGATTAEQAGKVFNPAKLMVQRTAPLREAFGLEAMARSIPCELNGGYIQPINSKGKTQDGWNPHVGILDELHAHGDRGLFDVIRSAFGARKNPLMWIITTAGYNLAGVCYEQRQFVTKVLDGALEAEHVFAIIYTLDEGDDPFDEEVWIKANPMIGVTPTWQSMREAAIEAKAGSDGEFKTKKLNLWLNSASAWLKIESWNACADPSLGWKDFEGLDCWIGADLADKDDITGIVLAAFDERGRLVFKPMFWLPETTLQSPDHAEGQGIAPYRTWHDEGWLNVTPGDWIDHGEIEDQITAWLDRYGVRLVTFDQFAAAQHMATRLNDDRGEPVAQILHKKASNFTDPAKELEARVRSGPDKLRHDGNPVMTWMASNAVVDRRVDGSILPKKESAMSPNKIDGIDALLSAIAPAVAVRGDDSLEPSPWEDESFSFAAI